jgi:hypothetical protein
LLKHRYQQPFISFPDAETPLFSIFHFFPPPPFFSLFSLPKQLRPAIVSPLLLLKHHASNPCQKQPFITL